MLPLLNPCERQALRIRSSVLRIASLSWRHSLIFLKCQDLLPFALRPIAGTIIGPLAEESVRRSRVHTRRSSSGNNETPWKVEVDSPSMRSREVSGRSSMPVVGDARSERTDTVTTTFPTGRVEDWRPAGVARHHKSLTRVNAPRIPEVRASASRGDGWRSCRIC